MSERRYDSDNETIYEKLNFLVVELGPELDLSARRKKCYTAIKSLPHVSLHQLITRYRGGMMETVHCELCNKDIERVKPDWEEKYEEIPQLIDAYEFEIQYYLRASWK